MGFGGSQDGSGRPASPRATDILKAQVESEIGRWLTPFEDALDATTLKGEPDHRTRITAAGLVLDRVYGKPTPQTVTKSPDLNFYGEPVDEAIDAEIERLTNDLNSRLDAAEDTMRHSTP